MDQATAVSAHVWHRTKVGWHLAFAAFAVVGAVLVVLDGALSDGRRTATLLLLGVVCAAYALGGAGVLHDDPQQPGGRLYLAVAVPATLAMFALAPVSSVMLFVLYPHIWCLLSTRWAAWTSAATSLSVGVVIVASNDLRFLGLAAVIVVVGLLVAILLGLWIGKIISQSAERAQLVADLARTREQLAEASRQAGVLAERERLARDLHDTVAQASTSVLMLLRTARKELAQDPAACERHLALAERTTRENLHEIRSLVAALTPPPLDGGTLPSALGRLADRLSWETGIDAAVSVSGTPRALPLHCEVTLLRVAQEALANVRRHSGARSVRIELGHGEDGVVLTVRDDGCGFDRSRPAGYGLEGLRSRVREAGGEFRLDTAVGSGATLTVRLPTGER